MERSPKAKQYYPRKIPTPYCHSEPKAKNLLERSLLLVKKLTITVISTKWNAWRNSLRRSSTKLFHSFHQLYTKAPFFLVQSLFPLYPQRVPLSPTLILPCIPEDFAFLLHSFYLVFSKRPIIRQFKSHSSHPHTTTLSPLHFIFFSPFICIYRCYNMLYLCLCPFFLTSN